MNATVRVHKCSNCKISVEPSISETKIGFVLFLGVLSFFYSNNKRGIFCYHPLKIFPIYRSVEETPRPAGCGRAEVCRPMTTRQSKRFSAAKTCWKGIPVAIIIGIQILIRWQMKTGVCWHMFREGAGWWCQKFRLCFICNGLLFVWIGGRLMWLSYLGTAEVWQRLQKASVQMIWD